MGFFSSYLFIYLFCLKDSDWSRAWPELFWSMSGLQHLLPWQPVSLTQPGVTWEIQSPVLNCRAAFFLLFLSWNGSSMRHVQEPEHLLFVCLLFGAWCLCDCVAFVVVSLAECVQQKYVLFMIYAPMEAEPLMDEMSSRSFLQKKRTEKRWGHF